LKTEEESWSARGRCSTLEPQETTSSSMMVHHLKDMSLVLDSSKGCKLQRGDFKHHNIRFRAPTFSLLTLHYHHRKGTTMQRILVLWDRATVVVRLGTMLIGVRGSRQGRLQLWIQTSRASTAMPTIVQLLQQGRTKLVLV
jgi:hypothetical protein